MAPPIVPDRVKSLLSGAEGTRATLRVEGNVEYTVVYPPTMLWKNFQRPHNVLTHLARRHEVLCLFNDWTVNWEELESGRLVVTKQAFRSKHHWGPFVYYFSIPEKLDYLRRHRLRPDLLVFELMDLPEEEFVGWKDRLPDALERSDVVRTTNPAITDYLREHFGAQLGDKSITTSYNGVDLALFDPDRTFTSPSVLEGVTKPILGFYGNLDWWIDWALMARLAELPEYQVVVIGDTEGKRNKIPPELLDSTILWIDRKPVDELPAFLDRFAVALFPFVVNEMTDAVDPLKVWEYFAFGKPVLATRTAFVDARPDLFEVVDPRAPAAAVAKAMEGRDDPTLVAARRAAAAARDWSAVADELNEEIVRALAARKD